MVDGHTKRLTSTPVTVLFCSFCFFSAIFPLPSVEVV